MVQNGTVNIVLITNVGLKTLRLSLGPLPERRENKVVFSMWCIVRVKGGSSHCSLIKQCLLAQNVGLHFTKCSNG